MLIKIHSAVIKNKIEHGPVKKWQLFICRIINIKPVREYYYTFHIQFSGRFYVGDIIATQEKQLFRVDKINHPNYADITSLSFHELCPLVIGEVVVLSNSYSTKPFIKF